MIGYLRGSVISSTVKSVLLLNKSQGIGYEINYNSLVSPGSELELFIYHHITDNDQSLWGFKSLEEKEFFVLLKSVNKVGASKAYALLGTLSPEEIVTAITTDSPDMLSKAPGIGKKMAEQIILSLRDKIKDIGIQPSLLSSSQTRKESYDPKLYEEAAMALDSLGYKDAQVSGLIKKALEQGALSSQEIIKTVLREM